MMELADQWDFPDIGQVTPSFFEEIHKNTLRFLCIYARISLVDKQVSATQERIT